MKKRLLPIILLALVSCTSGGNTNSEVNSIESEENSEESISTIISSDDGFFDWGTSKDPSDDGVVDFSEL